jgi:aspartate/methionine/tyrosine aminotransferase
LGRPACSLCGTQRRQTPTPIPKQNKTKKHQTPRSVKLDAVRAKDAALGASIDAFCAALVDEAGVLLLPGSIYDDAPSVERCARAAVFVCVCVCFCGL